MISNEKLKEILKELSRPKKFEVGFVDARRVISDGLAIIGLDSTDILGFAKEANEVRTRRVKGAQAWFKKMYEDGWRFTGAFEYEGLLYNGFIVMERELPNKRLGELIETLADERVVRTSSALEIDRGPELPKGFRGLVAKPGSLEPKEEIPGIEERMETTHKALKSMGYKEDEITTFQIKIEKKGDLEKAILKAREPKEGFDSELTDFIGDAQKEMKTLDTLFFDETGRNAIWKGKETKGFIKWKKDRD